MCIHYCFRCMTYHVSLNQRWQCLIVGVCPIQTQDIFLHIIKGLPHFIYLSNILSFFFLSLSPSLSLSSHPVEPTSNRNLCMLASADRCRQIVLKPVGISLSGRLAELKCGCVFVYVRWCACQVCYGCVASTTCASCLTPPLLPLVLLFEVQ